MGQGGLFRRHVLPDRACSEHDSGKVLEPCMATKTSAVSLALAVETMLIVVELVRCLEANADANG